MVKSNLKNTKGYKYLVKINSSKNENKFFEMIRESGGITVNSGRVGGKVMSKRYPEGKWAELFRKKILEGYEDFTKFHLKEVSKSENDNVSLYSNYAPVQNKEVEELIISLLNYAKNAIEETYIVGVRDVTSEMIARAERILKKLDKITKKLIIKSDELLIDDFNEYLQQLFSVLPRQMAKVEDNFLKEGQNPSEIIERENTLLGMISSQTEIAEEKVSETIEEAFGISLSPVTKEEFEQDIKGMLGDKARLYSRAFKVSNTLTETGFKERVAAQNNKKTKLFWHGSTNEAWWSILSKGLSLTYANYGMFGKGLYFANDADKSMGYSSTIGSRWRGGNSKVSYLGIFETAYGNPCIVKEHSAKYYGVDDDNFKTEYVNYDCIHAKAGMNLRKDEIIFYNNNQVTIRYLVEFKV